MKVCTKCLVMKPFSEYYKKRKSVTARCKACLNEDHVDAYRNNPHRRRIVRDAQIKYRLGIRDYIRSLKHGRACTDCKNNFPHYVLDYDHRPDESKLEDISKIASKRNWTRDRIDAEIAKCDIVCANCHRIRTWVRAH